MDSASPFHYEGELTFSGHPIRTLAEKFGTPLYVYSAEMIEGAVRRLKAGLPQQSLICYSMKANSNLSVLRLVHAAGAGVDIVSGGELYRTQRAGIDPGKIVFAGVGKTKQEMADALLAGILYFSVESAEELDALSAAAVAAGKPARISFRVNPDVNPGTHPYISTGLKENKFGVARSEVVNLYKKAKHLRGIEIVGIGFHIGSQLTDLSAFEEAGGIVLGFVEELRGLGIELQYISAGGGLGVRYDQETPPPMEDYAARISKVFHGRKETIVVEPGRSIVAGAGILVTEILYRKENAGKKFFICDAGMNDLIRPSLYQAYHPILSVRNIKEVVEADLVGPVCESGDFLAKNRQLPAFEQGDLAVIAMAGAYGSVMSSHYNSRAQAAEVLVEKSGPRLIRRRESYADLVRAEE